jgi:hypothetical protein
MYRSAVERDIFEPSDDDHESITSSTAVFSASDAANDKPAVVSIL